MVQTNAKIKSMNIKIQNPDVTFAFSALSYDACSIILDAIRRANSADLVKITDEIAKTKEFPGAAGVITINENNNAVKDAVLKAVKDDKFTYLDTIKP